MGVRISRNTLTLSLNRIEARLTRLPQDAYNYWKGITPVKSGNARRRTKLQGRKIKTMYGYAVPLDKGSSTQAPQGMSEPTERYIKQRMTRHILRK